MPGVWMCKPESCLDIYKDDYRNPSGNYVIFQSDKAIPVYCSFEENYVYTFISRKHSGTNIDMTPLYSTNKFAKLRILKPNGEQNEVTVENLSSFQNQANLSFNYNSHPQYQGPIQQNSGLGPYIFLGFLPISLTKNYNTQGYRASGVDYTFKNCDANPNSYLAFYMNPKLKQPGNVGYTNAFMTQWITYSTPLEFPQYMDSSLYFEWEMHMGGCGGLTTSKVVSDTKAALGLPFEIPEAWKHVHCKIN